MEFTLISHLVSYVRQLGCLNDQGGYASVNTTITGNTATANFPIAFRKVLTAVGTLSESVGTASGVNSDDGISWTKTSIRFRFYSHYFIAFGI